MIYNIRGAVMSSTTPVSILKINPSGPSFAVIAQKGKDGDVQTFDLWKSDKMLIWRIINHLYVLV